MRDEDHRAAVVPVQADDQLDHLFTGRCIQVTGRLVGEQDCRTVRERPRDGHPLLLTAGELHWIVMAARLEPDGLQQLVRFRVGFGIAGQLHRNRNVFARGQSGDQMERLKHKADLLQAQLRELVVRQLRDVPSVNRDGAGRGSVHAADEPQQGGLPASGRPDDGKKLLGGNVERDVIQDGDFAAAADQPHGEVADCDHAPYYTEAWITYLESSASSRCSAEGCGPATSSSASPRPKSRARAWTRGPAPSRRLRPMLRSGLKNGSSWPSVTA